jgi:hypothetical protein
MDYGDNMMKIKVIGERTETVFHNVPNKVGKAVITLLQEVENDDSKLFSSTHLIDNEER